MHITECKNLDDLAAKLGINHSYLVYYVYRIPIENQYKTFKIPKKGGGYRKIEAPSTNLKLIQKAIARELSEIRNFKAGVTGFVQGRSIKNNAIFHLRRRYVVNLDLKDFFNSITFPRVYGMLTKKPYNMPQKSAAVIAKACTFNGILPQGAPSSPIITNLICARMDSQLAQLAQDYNYRYSRYADDITFSTNGKLVDDICTQEIYKNEDTGRT